MSKVKNFSEFLKEEIYVEPPIQQSVQSQPIQQTQQPITQLQTPLVQPVKVDTNKIKKTINFAYLNIDSNMDKVKQVCDTAKSAENQPYIYGLVIRPDYISQTKKYLDGSDIKVITTISYPKGNETTSEKLKQIQKSISDGSDEINVVMNYKKLIDAMIDTDKESQEKSFDDIKTDIRTLVEYCKERSANINVVIEMEALSDVKAITKAVEICKKANVDSIVTSTDMFSEKTNYNFDRKLKDVSEIIAPLIQGTGDININFCGGITNGDRLMKSLNCDKVTKVTTTVNPQMLLSNQPIQQEPQTQTQ